jgi:hypothetical protein
MPTAGQTRHAGVPGEKTARDWSLNRSTSKSYVRLLACRWIMVIIPTMKLLAAIGVYLGFAFLIGLGIVLAVAKGSLWLLCAGLGLFLLAFIMFGCREASHPEL